MPAIEAGAQDIGVDDDVFEVLTEPADLQAVRAALEEAGIELQSAEVTQRPTTRVPLDEDGADKLHAPDRHARGQRRRRRRARELRRGRRRAGARGRLDGRPHRLPALREPAFRNLFAGQALSRLGDRIAPIALAVRRDRRSAGRPPTSGSWSRRARSRSRSSRWPPACGATASPRRSVMLASDGVRAVVQATAGMLLLAGSAEIWMLAALAAVYGTADAFFWPAMNGLLPETIESDVLQEANALLGWRRRACSNILGPGDRAAS